MNAPSPQARPQASTLSQGEELVCVRAGPWRLLIAMRSVERVLPAALPAVRPATPHPLPPVVAVAGELVPVIFAEALLGASEVALAPEHQMVLLRDGTRRALLWVEAVEEVVEHEPAPAGFADPGALVAGWSGRERPLAVLDVAGLVSMAS